MPVPACSRRARSLPRRSICDGPCVQVTATSRSVAVRESMNAEDLSIGSRCESSAHPKK